ncbi:inhibitor of Apoptosis domain protein [Ancylostoma duodenale]|uniref:Inhibitor of Apoptosis domain protein n=1 Tax=Ancylostoma duodenale TaxID=51022 RepID=A0A0C2FYH0_9BILA|nr:inhibitor of Apoptosis domain protein [Ancylostoma duodenale]
MEGVVGSKDEKRQQHVNKLISNISELVFYAPRKASFKKWCYDKKNSTCTSDALARAGFYFSGSRSEPAAATCAFCLKEMIFDEEDDPWEEHQSHCKSCSFVELGKLDEKEWSARDFIFLLSGRIAAEQVVAALLFFCDVIWFNYYFLFPLATSRY